MVCFVVLGLMFAGTIVAADSEPKIKGKPVSFWIKRLKSPNRGLQVRAARALSKAPTNAIPAIVPKLIPILASIRENDRFVAAQTLGKYGPQSRAAVLALIPLLKGTQYERNRMAAAKALGLILKDAKPSEEIDKVVAALIAKFDDDYDRYSGVRRESVRACGMIGPAAKACIPKVVRVLTYKIPGSQDLEFNLVRRATAWTLGRMGPLSAVHVDRLIAMMHAEGEYVPESVETLGLIGPVHKNVIPNIMDKLERSDPNNYTFRPAAFKALGCFGVKSAQAVPLTRRMLFERKNDGRYDREKLEMLKMLACVGPAAKEAVPEIQYYTGYKNKAVREEAVKTYKVVMGKASGS